VGRLEEAITACQEAAAIFREAGDQRSEGIAVNDMRRAQAAKAQADREE